MRLVTVVLAGAARLPVAPDPGLGAVEVAFVEEMPADALHGGGFAGGPDAGAGGQVGGGDGGDEGVAGWGTGGEVVPVDGGGRMLREFEAGGRVGDFDEHLDGLVGREHFEELADGRDGRLVAA